MFVCAPLLTFRGVGTRGLDTASSLGGGGVEGGGGEMVHIRHTSPGRPRGISDRKYLAVARVFYLGTAD